MDSTLVGRQDELRALSAWFRDAVTGHPRAVLLGGEPGIGKTRLAAALADEATADGATVVWGRGTELEGGTPSFWPWRQVLDRLGRADVLEPGDGDDPAVDRFAMFEGVTSTLAAAGEPGGLLVVLDDVHQIDAASIRLLVHVVGGLHGRVMLLATHRSSPAERTAEFDTAFDQLQRVPSTSRLDLHGLSRGEVAELLGVDLDGPTAAHAIEAAGGNPLLAGELARHLRAGHDLSTVPPSVRASVRHRLTSRSEACVRTLEVASVVGREFDAGLVATATGEPALATLEALGEAVDAGFVEPTDRPGRYRFVHALVRDAVEASQSPTALPAAHRCVAEALEVYDGPRDDVLAELARHWSAAAALGDREVAAGWCERAAEAADRRAAWEEAARLYDRSTELTGPDADPLDRFRRILGSARARLSSEQIVDAVERAAAAAETARALGRPDLMAEACMIAEGRGGPSLGLLQGYIEGALEALSPKEHALRARLLSLMTASAFYLDPPAVETLSLHSLAEAEATDEPLAHVAAARARQMALIEPQHAEVRLEIAERMGRAGRALGRPTISQWEPIWRIDALFELGRLPEVVAELAVLRRHVEASRLPISRWHLARLEALTAQAVGRFDEALERFDVATELFARLEDPMGAEAMRQWFALAVQLHTGFDPALGRQLVEFGYEQAPPFLGDLPKLAPIYGQLVLGDLPAAHALYDRLDGPTTWHAPHFLRLGMSVLRMDVATRLGRTDDLASLVEIVAPFRGVHAGASGGSNAYYGPVELWSGAGLAALGRHDAAVTDLRAALDGASRCGARPFAVQAATELAEVLATRRQAGDADEVAELVRTWLPTAQSLSMAPWRDRLAALTASEPLASDAGPLSARELEVAGLVARGLTNKAIATELYLSERTAQNHVQHILTKLGVSNRTQIAAWYRDRR